MKFDNYQSIKLRINDKITEDLKVIDQCLYADLSFVMKAFTNKVVVLGNGNIVNLKIKIGKHEYQIVYDLTQGLDQYGNKIYEYQHKVYVSIMPIIDYFDLKQVLSYWEVDHGLTLFIRTDMLLAPVWVVRKYQCIDIFGFCQLVGDEDSIFNEEQSWAQLAIKGIEDNWHGDFKLYNESVNVVTKIIKNSKEDGKNKDLNSFKIQINNRRVFSKWMTSHVFTGLSIKSLINAILSREWERFLYDWSMKRPGNITLYSYFKNKKYSSQAYKQMAAHEFGHILGIGDAYPAFYRNRKGAPKDYKTTFEGQSYKHKVPSNDMMRNNQKVTDNDIRMMWEAVVSGKPQFFPKRG